MREILLDCYGKFPGFKGLIDYCEKNNVTSIPTCNDGNCNNFVTYNKAYPNRGFTLYCSPQCSRKNKTINTDAKIKLEDRDWLYDQRIIQKKSKEHIASLLGVSVTPVIKYLKKHNIPDVRYNSSMASILHSKEEMISLYTDNKVKVIAQKLGVSSATVSRFLSKHQIETRCSNSYDRKFNKRSQGEQEVAAFLTEKGIPYKCNDRSLGVEIDLLTDKLAIEFNGVFFHTDKYKAGSDYHLNKTRICKENNIALFHIWSDQWKYQQDVVKSTLLHKLNLTPSVIYARKCEVKEVTGSEARLFLEYNHLQGYASASIKLGLYYNNKLVALMTFSKPRFNKHYQWELVRFATLNYTHVPGAFTKLLKSFRLKYSGNIITYADLSYSEGNVYIANGFTLKKTNKPSYSYISNDRRVSRTRFTKSRLKEFDTQLTECYITSTIGIPKVWDCGTQTYVL